jgi:hypothetical protein
MTTLLDGIQSPTDLRRLSPYQLPVVADELRAFLIDSVAKKMADDFFKAFRQQLLPPEPEEQVRAAAAIAAPAALPAGPVVSEPVASVEAQAPMAAGQVAGARISPTEVVAMVPAWWLAPAAVLGAALAVAGANLIR